MSENPTNIMVISDRIAPPEALGAVVYWSIRGETSYVTLCERLLAADIPADDLPAETTPSRALGRAAADASAKRVFCRSSTNDSYIVGVQIKGQASNRLREIGEFKLVSTKKGTETEVKLGFTYTGATDEHFKLFNELKKDVAARYEHELTILRPSDVGAFLISYAHQISSIALRPSGGFYFIPRPMKGAWSNLTNAVGSPHSFYEVPALPAAEAVHAITDALAEEIEGAIQSVRAELNDPEKPIGAKALDNRAVSCKALLKKVRAYEELLETKMDSMCEQINYLEVAVATAKVTLMGVAV